jgi:hypothetical protein
VWLLVLFLSVDTSCGEPNQTNYKGSVELVDALDDASDSDISTSFFSAIPADLIGDNQATDWHEFRRFYDRICCNELKNQRTSWLDIVPQLSTETGFYLHINVDVLPLSQS